MCVIIFLYSCMFEACRDESLYCYLPASSGNTLVAEVTCFKAFSVSNLYRKNTKS